MKRTIALLAMSAAMQVVCAQDGTTPPPNPSAPVTPRIKFESEDWLEATAAIPVFKFRQGEKFKIFDGIGGGLKWTIQQERQHFLVGNAFQRHHNG
jgi:hypothetical protein